MYIAGLAWRYYIGHQVNRLFDFCTFFGPFKSRHLKVALFQSYRYHRIKHIEGEMLRIIDLYFRIKTAVQNQLLAQVIMSIVIRAKCPEDFILIICVKVKDLCTLLYGSFFIKSRTFKENVLDSPISPGELDFQETFYTRPQNVWVYVSSWNLSVIVKLGIKQSHQCTVVWGSIPRLSFR